MVIWDLDIEWNNIITKAIWRISYSLKHIVTTNRSNVNNSWYRTYGPRRPQMYLFHQRLYKTIIEIFVNHQSNLYFVSIIVILQDINQKKGQINLNE